MEHEQGHRALMMSGSDKKAKKAMEMKKMEMKAKSKNP